MAEDKYPTIQERVEELKTRLEQSPAKKISVYSLKEEDGVYLDAANLLVAQGYAAYTQHDAIRWLELSPQKIPTWLHGVSLGLIKRSNNYYH